MRLRFVVALVLVALAVPAAAWAAVVSPAQRAVQVATRLAEGPARRALGRAAPEVPGRRLEGALRRLRAQERRGARTDQDRRRPGRGHVGLPHGRAALGTVDVNDVTLAVTFRQGSREGEPDRRGRVALGRLQGPLGARSTRRTSTRPTRPASARRSPPGSRYPRRRMRTHSAMVVAAALLLVGAAPASAVTGGFGVAKALRGLPLPISVAQAPATRSTRFCEATGGRTSKTVRSRRS